MNKSKLVISKQLVRFTLTSAMCLAISACNSTPDDTDTSPPLRLVRTFEVTPYTQQLWREYLGVVDAVQKANLGFRVPGKLEKLLVNEGDLVSANQLLAHLDATDYSIQLRSREAEYKQAHGDYLRAQKLVESGTISRSDYTKLQAQNSTAEASMASARQNLDYTSLRAPFAGRIAKRHIENFEEVAAKQVVYSLQDISSLSVKVDIPESVMINVKESAVPLVFAIFDTIPGRRFPLVFKEIATQSDPGTNTFQATFTMKAVDEYTILPGMSVTVRVEPDTINQQIENLVFLPAQAVLEDSQGRFVYIAKPEANGLGSVQRSNVETGKLSRQGLEILSGLSVGDLVITAGMSKMQPGLKVRLGEEKRP